MHQLKMFSNELQANVDITNGVYINNNPKMKDNSQTSVAKTCKKCCKFLLIHNRDKGTIRHHIIITGHNIKT